MNGIFFRHYQDLVYHFDMEDMVAKGEFAQGRVNWDGSFNAHISVLMKERTFLLSPWNSRFHRNGMVLIGIYRRNKVNQQAGIDSRTWVRSARTHKFI